MRNHVPNCGKAFKMWKRVNIPTLWVKNCVRFCLSLFGGSRYQQIAADNPNSAIHNMNIVNFIQ